MDIDTGLLRAFVAVAEDLHFGRAAARLHLTQQGVSKRIVRLEALVGVELVERTRRSVRLTPAGERMLPPARRAVDAADAAVASVQARTGSLRVDVLNEHLAPMQHVQQLSVAEADLELEVVGRERRTVVQMLRSGDADIAFGRAGAIEPPWPHDVRRRVVLAEPLELLVPADHRWADRDEVTCTELVGETLWFPMTGAPPEWTAVLDELAAHFGLRIDYGGSTMGFQHWVQRITDGQAPPSFFGAAMLAPPVPGVRRVAITHPTPVFVWSAMWRRRLPTSVVDRVLRPIERGAQRGIEALSDPELRWLPAADRGYLEPV